MQMTLLASIIILVSVMPTEQRNPRMGKERKPPVELWCVGDDVFSKGMCQAFFAAFESTPDFDLQEENKPGNLIITIPENVGWKKVGKRTKISYSVEFSTSDDRVFMTRKGSCWHKQYATCANQILRQARVAARKLPISTLLGRPSTMQPQVGEQLEVTYRHIGDEKNINVRNLTIRITEIAILVQRASPSVYA